MGIRRARALTLNCVALLFFGTLAFIVPSIHAETVQLTEMYSKYGFSFKYPKGMVLSELGMLEATATDSSGMVVGVLAEDQVISVPWVKTLQYDLESGVEGGLTGAEGTEGVTDFVRGDRGESTVKGHIVIYQFFSANMGGKKAKGIISAWYCDDSTRLYSISLISFEAGLEVFPLFEDYLDSFYCHEIAKMPSSISCSISSFNVKVGGTIDVSGSITPAQGEVTVTLTYERPDGSTLTRTATTDADGSFKDIYSPDRSGSWSVKASWIGDEEYEGAESSDYFLVEKAACIIATTTYGSELAPEVRFLRSFRQQTVYSTYAGSHFMKVFNTWYYSFSPAVAGFIETNQAIKTVMKCILWPLLGVLHLATITYEVFSFNGEVGIVMAGFIASALIGLIYFTPLTMIPLAIVRRYKKSLPRVKKIRPLLVSWLISIALIFIGEIVTSPIIMMFASGTFVVFTIALMAGIIALKIVNYIH